ncbi:MAG: endonuclease [Flavobacteriaceae bacterium]|nr:endonuclease [Flavobacteriaceae bacterium]
MINTFSIAFYNVENLFDTVHDKFTLDKDYTPEGEYQWNQDRYLRKIQNLSNVISKIGLKTSKLPPIFIGLAEIENETCLLDLIATEKLNPYHYDFVHYNSPDERGIDVAFLYQKEHFKLSFSNTYTLYLTDDQNNRDFTRDILLISGKLFNEPVFIIINHWPSRNGGVKSSDKKRIKAAKLVQEIITEIQNDNENPKIIIMGDFNDDPNSNSIKNHLMNLDLYNPMIELHEKNKGSVKYHGKWYLFDQIIFNKAMFNDENLKFKLLATQIFDDFFLQEPKGKRKGSPKRTFIGKWHLGGFSDHFPVLASFKKMN